MGKQQSRSGHGREGSHPTSQQGDRRPEQDRDLQQSQEPETQQSQLGGRRDFEHRLENEGREQNRMQQAERRQMSQQNAEGPETGQRASGQTDAMRSGGEYGEGNYAGTRQYDQAVKKFAESGRVEEAARAAAPTSDAEARELEAAEAEGKRHAKGEDPALTRGGPRPGREEN